MKKTIAGLVGALGISLALAPAAQADEYGYLDRLSDYNIVITDTSDVLNYGYLTCKAAANGHPPVELVAAVLVDNPGFTAYQAAAFVNIALTELCPAYAPKVRA